jgi:hypothetical protein
MMAKFPKQLAENFENDILTRIVQFNIPLPRCAVACKGLLAYYAIWDYENKILAGIPNPRYS